MTRIERFQTLIVLGAIGIGLALAQVPGVAAMAEHAILPCLIAMLFGVFLGFEPGDLRGAVKERRLSLLSLALNFVWNPIFAFGLGWLFLQDEPALRIGLLLLMVTPCTDWYIVFTGIARGNVALSTALLPWNLLLQLLLLPIYLCVFTADLVVIEAGMVFKSVALVLVLPLTIAWCVRRLALATKGRAWLMQRVMPRVQATQVPFLAGAIAAMFASTGTELLSELDVALKIVLPLLLFFTINLVIVSMLRRALGISYENYVSLCCTTLARNSPLALAIVLVLFPEQPQIAWVLVIAPLFELPLLGALSQLLLRVRRRTRGDTSSEQEA